MSCLMKWVTEKWANVETRYRIKSVLHEEKTGFQHLLLADSCEYGRMLLLDGIVQTTEKDEFIYHEMMVHVPMLSHPAPRKVLIIGGGDGGILRETLRYRSVEKVALVEIDPRVIDLSRQYLPGISKNAFDDRRAEVIIADGAAYVRETKERFDVVIVDSSDPIGPAVILFSEEFYSNILGIMNPSGIMVRQTGSIHMQAPEQRESFQLLKKIFRHAALYVYAVPTYTGGLFSSIFCSDVINPTELVQDTLQERLSGNPIETLYYNPGIHLGAFSIPDFLKDRLQ